MKHKPKNVRIKGQQLRRCRTCKLLWPPELEEVMAKEKCPRRGYAGK